MESNLPLEAAISNPKEKPLGAAGCIYIFLKEEIIFFLKWTFYSIGQIAALKPTLKI